MERTPEINECIPAAELEALRQQLKARKLEVKALTRACTVSKRYAKDAKTACDYHARQAARLELKVADLKERLELLQEGTTGDGI